MGWKRFLTCAPLLVLLVSCKETISGPGDAVFPAKLYPYEVTYDAAAFKQRRDDLVQQLPAGGVVLLTTNDVYLRNGDVDYDFRPASAFYYLTGFEEPNALAVIRKRNNDPASSELIMFVEERSAGTAQWLGPVYGPAGAIQFFGADSAYASGAFPTMLRAYLGSGTVKNVYANLDNNQTTKQIFTDAGGYNYTVDDVNTLLDGMRLIKRPLEMGLIRRAVDVSVQAFSQGIRTLKPSMYEYEVESVFDLVLRLNGCPRTSFPTIVASGPNITTIHYVLNNRQMLSGDLVMIDFGAEYGYYAADLTRTLPVNGKFNAAQGEIYDIVNNSLDAVIAAATPGASYATLSSLNIDILIEGLLQKGVISGTKSTIITSGQYRLYIPAGLGHPVGLDVHDPWPNDANNNRILRENLVLAIEPHIYLGAGDLTVAPAYRGVCARIEEDIRITSTGCEVLSASLPRTRVQIEAMMNK